MAPDIGDGDRYSALLGSLHEISLELSTLSNTDALCRRAVEWALANLGFDRVSLWFLDRSAPGWSQGTWGTDETGLLRDERHSRARKDSLVAPEAFYEGKIPVLFSPDEVCYDDQRRPMGRAAKALAPLWDGQTIIGEMSADCLLTKAEVRPYQLDGLVLFARIVAHLHTQLRTRQSLSLLSEERATLLRELKHRTRNNLSVIAGLVALESGRARSDEAREKLEVVRDRVEALGTLYALLDRDESSEKVRLDEYVETVALRLAEAYGAEDRGIRVELALQPVLFDGLRTSSVGIAVNELLTDALKYAFADGRHGLIRVSLSQHGEQLDLEVRDDGPGLPAGFDPERSQGLGVALVSALARQVGGRLDYRNDGGAVFSLKFSL